MFVFFFLLIRGELVDANRIQDELALVEAKASELDKKRTATICSISYINDRNRRKNIEEAEKAIMVCYLYYLLLS